MHENKYTQTPGYGGGKGVKLNRCKHPGSGDQKLLPNERVRKVGVPTLECSRSPNEQPRKIGESKSSLNGERRSRSVLESRGDRER